MTVNQPDHVSISQSVAILVDGNNIERSIHEATGDPQSMLNFDTVIAKLLGNRGLNRLFYFREGRSISAKLEERLRANYHGSVPPCHKSRTVEPANARDVFQLVDDFSALIRGLKYLREE